MPDLRGRRNVTNVTRMGMPAEDSTLTCVSIVPIPHLTEGLKFEAYLDEMHDYYYSDSRDVNPKALSQ